MGIGNEVYVSPFLSDNFFSSWRVKISAYGKNGFWLTISLFFFSVNPFFFSHSIPYTTGTSNFSNSSFKLSGSSITRPLTKSLYSFCNASSFFSSVLLLLLSSCIFILALWRISSLAKSFSSGNSRYLRISFLSSSSCSYPFFSFSACFISLSFWKYFSLFSSMALSVLWISSVVFSNFSFCSLFSWMLFFCSLSYISCFISSIPASYTPNIFLERFSL